MNGVAITKFSAGDKVGRWTVLDDGHTVARKNGKNRK